MTPSLGSFKEHMVRLGIQRDHQIVVYDSSEHGILSSAKCAWILRRYGASNVRILNGGLKKWLLDGRAVVENVPMPTTEFKEQDGNYDYSPQATVKSINLQRV